jgi:hypothetical protein
VLTSHQKYPPSLKHLPLANSLSPLGPNGGKQPNQETGISLVIGIFAMTET